MKYVTLEHRRYGTIGCSSVNFDTNDITFETEASELRHQRFLEREKIRGLIEEEAKYTIKQAEKIDNELKELKNNIPILQRLFSHEYKTKNEQLQSQYRKHRSRYSELITDVEQLDENHSIQFNRYHDLIKLLKEHGYVLVNKTTNNHDITTEIWHKD